MKYLQGKFEPKHPEKYIGDVNNIVFRSSWERKACIFFDENPAFTQWGSEEFVVPYISPLDNRPHRYFPDFIVKRVVGEDTKIFMVEVKPAAQCQPPKQRKKTKRMIMEVETYAVNQAKWDAARRVCHNNGWEFIILTEKELNI